MVSRPIASAILRRFPCAPKNSVLENTVVARVSIPRFFIASLGIACSSAAFADRSVEATPKSIVLHDDDGLVVRGHVQFGLNAVSERNLFWNFAESTAPDSGFDSDANWIETYAKIGVSFEQTFGGGGVFFGKGSAVASYTQGTDAYDTGDTGRVTLEEGYLGFRAETGGDVSVEISLGPRELKLGSGMLVANGASSGFERGALKFGPRKAWENAAIASVASGNATARLFYLDPNETPSSDGGNALAGLDVRFDGSDGDYVGLTYLNVFESDSSYPQAAPSGMGAPVIRGGAREGLNAINVYGRLGWNRRLSVTTDFAYEWNNRIDLAAWAGRVQVAYSLSDFDWSPTLTYSFQSFSGDDPSTSGLERFDPLYYEGSPSAWATGSKSSMVFINSNVYAHGLALRLSPTDRDSVTLRYAHIRANELFSPIQFGQATRVDFSNGVSSVISGVSDAHLADDFFLEYGRVLNPNTFLTAGLSVSVPGRGITTVTPNTVPTWTGGFINVVFNF